MACDAQTLLDDAKCFLCLGEKQLDVAIVQLLREWLLSLSPSADVTPQGLLNEASCLNCLSTKDLMVIQTQLLCDMEGGTSCAVDAPTNLQVFPGGAGVFDAIWQAVADPVQDFLFQWGTVSGGPYNQSDSIDPTLRAKGIFTAAGHYFGVIIARDSDECVSDPSNEVEFTIT